MRPAGRISSRCWKPTRACSSEIDVPGPFPCRPARRASKPTSKERGVPAAHKKLLARAARFCIVTVSLLKPNMEPKADIALIGLAVMGQNLILNMNDHGYTVVAFNRTVAKVDEFVAKEAKGTNVIGAHSIEEMVGLLKKPRRVMLMVKAGKPVDEFIEQLIPQLEPGDIIIDGGNSLYEDTNRRTKYLESKGLLFIGTGVSGGEEGARHGPSIMPGGSPAAWPHLKPIFQAIAAKVDDGTPCCVSALKDERLKAARKLKGPRPALAQARNPEAKKQFTNEIRDALYSSKIVSYTQGYMLMRAAAADYNWNLNYGGIALMWRGGCIIRSRFLGKIKDAFDNNPKLANLMLDDYFRGEIKRCQKGWRNVVAAATKRGIPAPAFGTALAFYDQYRAAVLPANLLQAQRDYSDSHAYERADKPRGEFFHTNWTGRGGTTASGSYTV